MKKVLVAGATGYLRRYLVSALEEEGYWVRVLVRNSSLLNRFGSHGAPPIFDCIDEVFEAEATKPETIKGVCDGIDIVFSSIGITRQKDGMSYKDVDYQGNLNLLGQAEASKVTTFIYISVFKGNEISGLLNMYKEKFGNKLKESGLAYLIIRPTGFFSDMEEFFQMSIKGRVAYWRWF